MATTVNSICLNGEGSDIAQYSSLDDMCDRYNNYKYLRVCFVIQKFCKCRNAFRCHYDIFISIKRYGDIDIKQCKKDIGRVKCTT